MNIDWQDTTVAVLLILAGGYLAYRSWLVMANKKSGGCGSGCSSCDEGSTVGGENKRPFVSLEQLTQPPKNP